jgi:hypothetical protein
MHVGFGENRGLGHEKIDSRRREEDGGPTVGEAGLEVADGVAEVVGLGGVEVGEDAFE